MGRTYITRDALVAAVKAGTEVSDDAILRKQYAGSIEKKPADATEGDRTRKFIISTEAPDRDNDTIKASGWKLANYRKNPVILYAHDYSSLPIGKCTDIKVVGGQLLASAEFADHDMANTVLRLIDGGFLNATSVGFRPSKHTYNEERRGMDFSEQELLEFSVVPVPANPEALIVAREFIGDVELVKGWAERTLEALKAPKPKPKPAADGETPAADDDEADPKPPFPPKKVFDAIDAIKAELPTLIANAVKAALGIEELSAEEKAGRVLSTKNETRIRTAKSALDEVLSTLGTDDAEAAAAAEAVAKAEQDAKATADKAAADAAEKTEEFALDLDDSAETYELDPKELQDLFRAEIAESMRGLPALVGDEVAASIRRMRGRLD